METENASSKKVLKLLSEGDSGWDDAVLATMLFWSRLQSNSDLSPSHREFISCTDGVELTWGAPPFEHTAWVRAKESDGLRMGKPANIWATIGLDVQSVAIDADCLKVKVLTEGLLVVTCTGRFLVDGSERMFKQRLSYNEIPATSGCHSRRWVIDEIRIRLA
eukprot:scpid86837/ scgid32965/ 